MTPTNYDDIIDTRDIQDRIDELESERDDFIEEHESADWADEYPDEAEELATLLALKSECLNCTREWDYGEALIRDSYFAEYAQQLAEDIGAISSDQSWPLYCIDWEQAARDLQQDYSCVTYDGVDYWIRST